MKITFQNQTVTDTENRTESIQTEKNTWGRDKIQRNKKSVNANTFGAVYESGQIPMPVGNEENNKGKSLIELQQDAGNTNVALQQDYMTLLSHTMSQEDYAKACEDGFDPRELDQDTAVTIVDRIKAELVRSGQNIAGYTDDIDLDTLAAAVGSDTLAQSIEEQFRATDIPLTPENVDELKTAWELASSLQQPQEGEVGYLVDNGLEPEIWNLYVAENSGAKVQQNTVPQELQDQMDKVITDAGLPVNDENRQKAQWLVGAGLPLTTDTLQQLAEQLDEPIENVALAIQAAQPAMSLTPENGEDGDRQLDIPVESPEEELADKISLAEVIEALPEQDKQLIRLRFYGNRTQSETAKALHTTQVQISRRERKILIRLRTRLLEE